jgi:hypothetical protein
MDPVTIGAAIAGGTQLIGQGVNALSQGNMNKKTRAWNEMMYERQKSDNLKLWEMQNQYNAPTAQMQRLNEAGLNPNLVYGSGGGSFTSPTPKSADAPTWNPTAPKVDASGLSNTISQFYDLKMRDAQIKKTNQETEYLKTQDMKTMMETSLIAPRGTAIELANTLASNTLGYNTDASRLKALQAQKDYDFKTDSYLNTLKGQILDNLGKELRNAKTQVEKSYINTMMQKIQNEVTLQKPEIEFAQKFSGQRGMQGAGMTLQLLKTILGK